MKNQIVFIPGLSCGPALWDKQIAALADIADCKVVLNQFADSDEMADLIVGAFPSGPITVVTHSSVGCMPGFAAAVAHPDRINKMVLLGACVEMGPDLIGFLTQCISDIQGGGYDEFKKMLVGAALGQGYPNQSELESAVAATQTLDADTVIKQCEYMIKYPSGVEQLAEIQAETLVIAAENDGFFDLAVANDLAQRLANSKLTVLPNTGHMMSIERDVAISALLRLWLQ